MDGASGAIFTHMRGDVDVLHWDWGLAIQLHVIHCDSDLIFVGSFRLRFFQAIPSVRMCLEKFLRKCLRSRADGEM